MLQFSNKAFRKFKQANAHVFKEKQVTTLVIPIIKGKIKDAKCVAKDILFTNLDYLIDRTLALSKLDLFYNAYLKQLNKQIYNKLSSSIILLT